MWNPTKFPQPHKMYSKRAPSSSTIKIENPEHVKLKDLTAISKPEWVDIPAQVSGCVKQGEEFLEGVRVALAKANIRGGH